MILASGFKLLFLCCTCMSFAFFAQTANARPLHVSCAISRESACVGSFDCSVPRTKQELASDPEKHIADADDEVRKNEVSLLSQMHERLKMEDVAVNQYPQKLILNPQLLSKGGTPPSGPNPGHNDLNILAVDQKFPQLDKKAINSLLEASTTPSPPDPALNLAIDHESQLLNYGQQHDLQLENEAKGSTPSSPSGPGLGRNGHFLTGSKLDVSNNSMQLLIQKQVCQLQLRLMGWRMTHVDLCRLK